MSRLRTNPVLKKTVLHVAAWASILSISFFLFYSGNNSREIRPLRQDWRLYLHFIITIVSLAGIFYLYSSVLIPRLFKRKKIILFVVVSAFLLVGFVIGMNTYFRFMQAPVAADMMPQGCRGHSPPMNMPVPPSGIMPGAPEFPAGPFPSLPYSVTLFPFIMVLAGSIAYRYIRDDDKKERLLKEGEMNALSAELQFLKSQISPHFLFNVLNNITYLARKSSTLLEPSLIKMSSLLRYMLYDTNEEKVLLDKEIKYLEDYIGLQQLRNQDLMINSYFLNEQEDIRIAPMLLIPFIENAYKHAGSFVDNGSFINIELVGKNSILYFKVSNKYTETEEAQKDNASGIGLVNVQKRLQLLYPEAHELLIKREAGIFTISLRVVLE
ncbi:sensor histidine kinase [Chitinophaga sp. YR573]|uniref:sensor histidine kinase n=1 Tax=Chitinophaga sp. YR573 TaxID=1881040 RepID=UPI000B7D6FBA|nr:sensor histidine kinase [Chitinophaga sp. YR573]